jgi:hypothetical protein
MWRGFSSPFVIAPDICCVLHWLPLKPSLLHDTTTHAALACGKQAMNLERIQIRGDPPGLATLRSIAAYSLGLLLALQKKS